MLICPPFIVPSGANVKVTSTAPPAVTVAGTVETVTVPVPSSAFVTDTTGNSSISSGSSLDDPLVFYDAGGSEERLRENRQRMIESCLAFLALDRVESHPMSEYVFGER